MHRGGARGVRCNAVQANGTGLEKIQSLAAKIAPLGWHMQIYIEGARLPGLVDDLLALPVPVVIDHMGQMPPGEGLDGPAFRALTRLLASGRGLGEALRLPQQRVRTALCRCADAARAMIAAAPEHCLWGTDWPHPNLEGRADAG